MLRLLRNLDQDNDGELLNVDIRTETSRRLGRYKSDHRGSIKAA